jgi:hypothetical protein
MALLSKGSPGSSGEGRGHRPGVCHRCGWSGLVFKPSRADRRRLKIGRTLGRICDECAASLLGQGQLDEEASRETPRVGHRRNVA